MAEVLSNDEIEALFSGGGGGGAAKPGAEAAVAVKPKKAHRSVSTFDFTKPNRFSPQEIQSLWRLHEMAASKIQLALSTTLRLGVRVELMDLEQVRFETLVESIGSPSVICMLEANPLRYGGLLAMDYELAYVFLERLLGGGGASDPGQARELTQLESVVIDGLLDLVFRELEETWSKSVPMKFRITAHESNPQYCRVMPPKEVVMVVTYGIGGELGFGEMRMALPHLGLEPYLEKLAGTTDAAAEEDEESSNSSLSTLRSADIDGRLVLGKAQIPLRDLLSLQLGDVVPLDSGLHDAAEFHVAGQPKFLGKTVMHNGSLAFLVESRSVARVPEETEEGEENGS
jgi:flagellar motor switch protein FliM